MFKNHKPNGTHDKPNKCVVCFVEDAKYAFNDFFYCTEHWQSTGFPRLQKVKDEIEAERKAVKNES